MKTLPHPGPRRHTAVLPLALAMTLMLTACASPRPEATAGPGPHCYRSPNRMSAPLCTSAPGAAAEREARSFPADPAVVTVYVIRHSWGDAAERVALSTTHTASTALLPKTVARLRLPPGQTELTASWAGGSTRTAITGSAGSLQFVELTGTVWAWGADFRFAPVSDGTGRSRVGDLRLVADVVAARP